MIDPTHYAITMLMSRPKIPMHVNLTHEERECIVFADRMRVHTVKGRYKGIWAHIPNQGKRHRLVAIILRAMGLIPGATDYYFIWDGGACVIEMKAEEHHRINKLGKQVKVAEGPLSEFQGYFRLWCEQARIPWAKCITADEAEQTLRALGGLA